MMWQKTSAATADDSAATADTLSVTRTIILLAVLMISAGVICLTLYRRKEMLRIIYLII